MLKRNRTVELVSRVAMCLALAVAVWTPAVADGMTDARGQVLMRMMAWLAGTGGG